MTINIEKLSGKTYTINGREFFAVVSRFNTHPHRFHIQIMGDCGPETKLSINLPEFDDLLEHNQIFTKASMINYNESHLKALGFVHTNRNVGYGNFDSVAMIFELKA